MGSIEFTSDKAFQLQRYRVEEKIGSGGVGSVFRGFDTKLQRPVALKFIPDQGSHSWREAHTLARVSNAYVVNIYDVVQDGEWLVIVMELVESANELSLESLQAMNPERFLPLYYQLLFAIEAVHKAGVLHLDIKPSNLLLSESGQIKVADFGISLLVDDREEWGQQGSWFCLTPEQIQKKSPTTASDIFALGVLLYAYLYQRHPFVDKNLQATQESISQANLNKSLPLQHESLAPLVSLVEAMLDQSPSGRPALDKVKQCVLQVMESRDISNPVAPLHIPTATMDISVVSKRRWSWKILSAITTVLLLAVSVTLYFALQSRPMLRTLVVPTLKINDEAEGSLSAEIRQNNLIAAVTMEDELEAAVIQDVNRLLVSKKEWGGTTDWKKEAQQLDVDEIIFSDVRCDVEFCEVNLGVYSRELDRKTHSIRDRLPSQPLSVFSHAFSQQVKQELSIDSAQASTTKLNETDWVTYATYKNQFEMGTLQEGAVGELEALTSKYPSFAGGHLLLGRVYLNLYSESKSEVFLDKADTLAINISKVFPHDPVVMELVFRIHLRLNNLALAEDILQRLEYQTGLDFNQLRLIRALHTFKTSPKEGYQKLLEGGEPRLTNSYFHHKAYMEDLLLYGESLLKTAEQWSDLFPEAMYPTYFKAKANFHMGNLQAAKKLYLSINSKDSSSTILYNLMSCELFLGNYQSALEIGQKLLSLSESDFRFLSAVGQALKALGDSTSTDYFKKVLENLSQKEQLESEHYFFQALAFAQLGYREKATIALEQAAHQKADNFYLYAAEVHSIIGNPQAALYNAKQAVIQGYKRYWFNLPWMKEVYLSLPER